MSETAPEKCPRCGETYLSRMLPAEIGRMTVFGDRVICENEGWLYFHVEHSRL